MDISTGPIPAPSLVLRQIGRRVKTHTPLTGFDTMPENYVAPASDMTMT
ncbi:hypothetical protein [Thauera sp.]|nr:hypothetical protein [Thauera sp.]